MTTNGRKRATPQEASPSSLTKRSSLSEARHQVANSNAINLRFSRFASKTAQLVGHPFMFLFAVVALLVWAVVGPLFRFSDTWQLVINTGTTIVTFLVVFLIQNTQNRDAKALHLKMDELEKTYVRFASEKGARTKADQSSILKPGCAERQLA